MNENETFLLIVVAIFFTSAVIAFFFIKAYMSKLRLEIKKMLINSLSGLTVEGIQDHLFKYYAEVSTFHISLALKRLVRNGEVEVSGKIYKSRRQIFEQNTVLDRMIA